MTSTSEQQPYAVLISLIMAKTLEQDFTQPLSEQHLLHHTLASRLGILKVVTSARRRGPEVPLLTWHH